MQQLLRKNSAQTGDTKNRLPGQKNASVNRSPETKDAIAAAIIANCGQ